MKTISSASRTTTLELSAKPRSAATRFLRILGEECFTSVLLFCWSAVQRCSKIQLLATPSQVMIHLSRAAANEVNRLQSRCPNPIARFRLGVKSGGCSGFYYTLQFDETQPEDQLLSCDGIEILINTQDLAYVDGLALDYSEDLMGGGFRFHNSNAAQHCGCGNSFSIVQR